MKTPFRKSMQKPISKSNLNINIGIICGRKKTDAALCENLEKVFPNLHIVQYQIPFKYWFSWLAKRIKKTGMMRLLGHLLLSTFLRLERAHEKNNGTSLWLKYRKKIPDWHNVNSRKKFLLSEKRLFRELKNVDAIIFLDSFRMSHRFYRNIKAPCLQVVWGKTPDYMGDSGCFWAYIQGENDRLGVSVIKRTAQLNQFDMIGEISILADENENLRTLKIKQVVALEKILPKMINAFLTKKNSSPTHHKKITCRFFYAPTLFTYLEFLNKKKLASLPSYSYSEKICSVRHLKKFL